VAESQEGLCAGGGWAVVLQLGGLSPRWQSGMDIAGSIGKES